MLFIRISSGIARGIFVRNYPRTWKLNNSLPATKWYVRGNIIDSSRAMCRLKLHRWAVSESLPMIIFVSILSSEKRDFFQLVVSSYCLIYNLWKLRLLNWIRFSSYFMNHWHMEVSGNASIVSAVILATSFIRPNF